MTKRPHTPLVLAILDGNPVHALSGFARLMKRVPTLIHAGLHADETASRCHWH